MRRILPGPQEAFPSVSPLSLPGKCTWCLELEWPSFNSRVKAEESKWYSPDDKPLDHYQQTPTNIFLLPEKKTLSVFELLSVGFSVNRNGKYSLSVANIHFMGISLTDLHRFFSELFSTSSLNPEQAELLRQSGKKKSRSYLSLVSKLCLTLLQPFRLLCPWDSPGKNTDLSCHFLLQEIFPTQGSNPRCLLGRQLLYHWATWEAHCGRSGRDPSLSGFKKKKKDTKLFIELF